MIKDAQGRKWFMRFKQYRQGWHWEARHDNNGQTSGMRFFRTKVLAEIDARRVIESHDAIAVGAEYFPRALRAHGFILSVELLPVWRKSRSTRARDVP